MRDNPREARCAHRARTRDPGVGRQWEDRWWPQGRAADRVSTPLRMPRPQICPGDRHPAFSPDGTRIAFMRGAEVVVARPDATGVRVLGSGQSPSWAPLWSPDGRLILVVCHPPGRDPARSARLCTLDANGPARQRPNPISSGGGVDFPSGWSRTGRRSPSSARFLVLGAAGVVSSGS